MAVTINASTSTGLVQSADTSGEIELQSNGTTALKVNTNEGIQILNCLGVGNATPSTSGAGITFPATQSASSDANTLDDYEEGTWTPTLRFGTGSTGITYTTQQGRYIKIGTQVTVFFLISLSNKGSSTGGAGIVNLPFSASGAVNEYVVNMMLYSGFSLVTSSTGTAYLDNTLIGEIRAGNSTTNLSDTNFTNTSWFWGGATYIATA